MTRATPLGWTRRDFLRSSGAAALTLGLGNLDYACRSTEQVSVPTPAPTIAVATAPTPIAVPAYRSWEDLYRQKWTWDRVARGTHTMTNCVSGCAWDLYVKDDMVWREEQKSPYTASSPGLAGLQSARLSEGRLRRQPDVLAVARPLPAAPRRRARRRALAAHLVGRGVDDRRHRRWSTPSSKTARRRSSASWARTSAPDPTAPRPSASSACSARRPPTRWRRSATSPSARRSRSATAIRAARPTTGGARRISCCGPSTRRPRASRTRTSSTRRATAAPQVVAICPDLNNSAIHADLWLNPRPGTDAALALGAAQVIIAEKLYDAAYVAEQTDLPLLVRTDTGRFVRESDLRRGGSDTAFFVWDAQAGAARCRRRAAARSRRLDAGDLKPGPQLQRHDHDRRQAGARCAPCSRCCASVSTATIGPSRSRRSPASRPRRSAASRAASPRRPRRSSSRSGGSASSCTPIWRSARRSCWRRSPATSDAPAAAGAPAASSHPKASRCSASKSGSAWSTSRPSRRRTT